MRFDEYTEDILPNRLIRAAIYRLGRLRLRSASIETSYSSARPGVGNVALLEYHPRQVPEVSYNRLNVRYRPAVELSRLVLRLVSFDVERGRVTTPGLLVDMNDVFEGFVYTALREALGLPEWTFPHGAPGRGIRLDESRRIHLFPDLSWWEGGRCVFVGDVKYKRTVDQAVPNADLYQLLAYTVATDLPGGLLIYAQGEEDPWVHSVVHLGRRLEVIALNMTGSERDVLDQIEVVARRIAGSSRPPTGEGGISRHPQPAGSRGSQLWLQRLVNDHPGLLDDALASGGANMSVTWVSPLREDQYAEYRDGSVLLSLGVELARRPLTSFWPAHRSAVGRSGPPRRGSPSWLKLSHTSRRWPARHGSR